MSSSGMSAVRRLCTSSAVPRLVGSGALVDAAVVEAVATALAVPHVHVQHNETDRLWLHVPSLPSTQSTVLHSVLPALDGAGRPDAAAALVVRADVQDDGHGRGGTVWSSPPGSLSTSVVCTVPRRLGSTAQCVQYVAALAVAEAVVEAAPDAAVRLKWPNDVLLAAEHGALAKLAGVLCHMDSPPSRPHDLRVVCGVGVNLTNATPPFARLADVARVASAALDPHTFEQAVVRHLDAMLAVLTAAGSFAPLQPQLYRRWLHTNAELTLETGEEAMAVQVVGVTPDGFLSVRCVWRKGASTVFT